MQSNIWGLTDIMNKTILASGLMGLAVAGNALAAQGPVPGNIPLLDHVFVIMMENHAYGQIAANPDTPFINSMMQKFNSALNYHGIAHPSSQNYLDVVGGSNFNNLSDQYPDWHNTKCSPNMATGITNVDVAQSSFPSVVGLVCPITGKGTDAAIPALDQTDNEGVPPLANIDGTTAIPAESNIVGKTIADQLVVAGKSWKSYQEGLPVGGADGVNVSDGFFIGGGVNAAGTPVSTDFSTLTTAGNPVSASDIVYLYAVKHNPFAYFASVQEGKNPALSLSRVVAFEGQKGLYADLKAGTVPNFAFIAPQPVQRPAWSRQQHRVLQLRRRRQRHAGRPQPQPDAAGRPGSRADRHGDQGLAGVAEQQERHRPRLGRERLQHEHVEPGGSRRQHELRPEGRAEPEVLHALFADQDARRRLRSALPQSCLRRGRESHGRLFQE